MITDYEKELDTDLQVWINRDGRILLPHREAEQMIQQMHQWTHLGEKKLIATLKNTKYIIPQLKNLVYHVVPNCIACQNVNTHPNKSPSGKRLRGDRPGVYWEVDFTEIKPARYGNKYLLVFIDTFSGWVEASPTKKETATVVAKKILEDIFPRFRIPKVIGSDNGPAFIAQVSQGVAKYLGFDWKLHCAHHPQSSGQVERMNKTLKETLTKLTMETGGADWVMLLPLVLFRVRNTPSLHNLTPFEILYWLPVHLTTMYDLGLPSQISNSDLYARL